MNLASRDVSGDFPASEKIYLNSAAISVMPSQSIEAMREFLISYNSAGPDSKESWSFVVEKLQNLRRTISEIISCRPEEVILTQSTTDGVNIVANGLSLDADSNIIIRGMSHEHHSNLYPWVRLGYKTEVRSLTIDRNGFFDLDDLESRLDENTGLVALSHALYNTGSILPIQKVGQVISGRTPFFVDSAQTVGCLDDVDVSRIRCDFMSFNGSKWLCGPIGMGLFYCRKDSSYMLESAAVGGESATLDGETGITFRDIPDKFQTGFRNYAGVVGLESSARYLQKFGIDSICKKNRHLSTLLRDELACMPNIILYGPESAEERTSIVSFNISGFEPDDVVTKLEKQNMILAVREIINTKMVRASPHFFNTESQILDVVDAIRKL